MRNLRCWVGVGLLLSAYACGSTTQVAPVSEPDKPAAVTLPADSAVTIGKLPNGLTYIIRENREPRNRAELRLVVNAGSILEDTDQQGLAHFTEHMAFNGTKNFPKQALVDYLESIGMRFGPDVNAYTGFDETVYMLQVPMDSTEVVRKAFAVLQDWAHNVSFEDEEIDKERGVIVEEWRLGRGANARIRDKQFPILFRGSRYAERLPIGEKAVLDTFRHDTIRRFYRDWYRPDLMAVVAVGDFETQTIRDLIDEHFALIPASAQPRERQLYPVPKHEETSFAIATDPEATWNSVDVVYKQNVRDEGTKEAYRQGIVESLFNRMLNQRFYELTKTPDAPFLRGSSGQGRWVRTSEIYYLSAQVKEGGILRGLDALLTEAARVKQHGFTPSELEREKVEVLRGLERAYEERDKTPSRNYASEYIRHYLSKEPIPGITAEYGMYRDMLPGIQLTEVNGLAAEWMSDKGRVILVDAPEKEGLVVPGEDELLAAMSSVASKQVEPYEEAVTDEPLVATPPEPGKIVIEKRIKSLGTVEWGLSNGVRVFLKPTDFRNDQIQFAAFSPGGHSLVPDEDYIPASTATAMVGEGGIGTFDLISLQKKLAGKVASARPFIGTTHEGLRGGASPKDIETLFELIYLTFTAPRPDTTAFLAYRERLKGMLENRNARPETAFGDTIQVTMAQYHHRARPWSMAILDELDLEKSLSVYRDRFSDAGDFTFIFVGNLDLEALKPLVAAYLGGLPSAGRIESWRDVGMRPPSGVVEKVVKRGLEPKSRVQIIFTGPFEWERQNIYDFYSMRDVFRIKLREVLREDEGGTYSPGVSGSVSHFPVGRYSVRVSFGCNPERVDELTSVVFTQIDSLRDVGTTETYVQKVQETQRRGRETSLRDNGFWLGSLQSRLQNGDDLETILRYDELVDGLTTADVQETAKRYFNRENYVKVVLYPEAQPDPEPQN